MNTDRRRLWIRIGAGLAVLLIGALVTVELLLKRAEPILKKRIENTLEARFHGDVELGFLEVSVIRGLEVTGGKLKIQPPASIIAAGAKNPVIQVEHFSFHTGWFGLLASPLHVNQVRVSGLQMHVPPRETRPQSSAPAGQRKGKIEIDIGELVCENSRLVIDTNKPGKDPRDFELQHIVMREVGPDQPWKYDAVLVNAIPRGDIHATGTFKPSAAETLGDSALTGNYRFDRADLNTIKGIGGILSSVGEFEGQLDRIHVQGKTDTPDFSLDTANHPMHLQTQFDAVVDGTSGDTYLQPVKAKLRDSEFTVSGSVVNIKGVGHRIDLDLDIPAARLQDFLELAVKTKPVVTTGRISCQTKLQILPGKESVPQKLRMAGRFQLEAMHFTNTGVQDKVDMLSMRAQGRPKEAVPGAPDVNSRMEGQFTMEKAALHFTELGYKMPGARVALQGTYTLDGQQFDFNGTVFTDASLSHMVASPWKSTLLKIVPLFRRKGGGAEIPVSISGTQSEPKFGVNILGH